MFLDQRRDGFDRDLRGFVMDGLDHPNKIVLDAAGNFNMVGAGGVEVRKPDGTLVGRWGEKGDGPGQFIATVHGGWIDDQGALYTAEAGFVNRSRSSSASNTVDLVGRASLTIRQFGTTLFQHRIDGSVGRT